MDHDQARAIDDGAPPLAAADGGDSEAAPAQGQPAGDTSQATARAPSETASAPHEDDATEPAPTGAAKEKPKDPAPLPAPLYGKADPSCGKGPGIGQKLASFSLATPKGKRISPAMYRGRVLLVNFWGTWCKPCLEELPKFDQIYRRYRRHGMTLLAVATDEDPQAVQDFLTRRKIAARVAIGGEAYASRYNSDRFPFTFVVDSKGVIVSSYRGYEPRCMGQIEADIRQALERRRR